MRFTGVGKDARTTLLLFPATKPRNEGEMHAATKQGAEKGFCPHARASTNEGSPDTPLKASSARCFFRGLQRKKEKQPKEMQKTPKFFISAKQCTLWGVSYRSFDGPSPYLWSPAGPRALIAFKVIYLLRPRFARPKPSARDLPLKLVDFLPRGPLNHLGCRRCFGCSTGSLCCDRRRRPPSHPPVTSMSPPVRFDLT